jgi:hypothetical protein
MSRFARSAIAPCKLTALALVAFVLTGTASAQKTVVTGNANGASPHVKSTWTVAGATISVEYGRPSLRGRPEAQMMPAGTPWRTGADVATIITTDKPLTFGSITLKPGSYTINTEPGDKEWHLLLGKLGSPTQWGIPYLPDLEIGRVPMKLSRATEPVEQLTIGIEPGQAPTLRITWGKTVASAAFKIGS